MKKKLLAGAIILLIAFSSIGQTSYRSWPQIGKPFSDFVLDSVDNYSKKTITYNDFKGKWVILDFWAENCSGCIASFPKINALQKKFQDDIQFVLIAETYKNPQTAITLFNRLKKKFGLSVPGSFDQNFVNDVGPDGLPTLIIINPKGIVAGITHNVTEIDIHKFLSGDTPVLERVYLGYEKKPSDNYDRNIPLLINENGGGEMDYMYRSIITKWTPTMPSFNTFIRRNRLEIFRVNLKDLYLLAYFGTDSWDVRDTLLYRNCYRQPILKIRDSTYFESDVFSNKNMFCYSLCFRKDVISGINFNQYTIVDKPKFQRILQRDLESCFGYSAKIEKQKMRYLRLIATNDARKRLKTKGGPTKIDQFVGNKGLNATNIPMDLLIAKINSCVGFPFELPILDETGIIGNIDIEIDALFYDDWLNELRKIGLDLEFGEKNMNVLVIGNEINTTNEK